MSLSGVVQYVCNKILQSNVLGFNSSSSVTGSVGWPFSVGTEDMDAGDREEPAQPADDE